MPIITISLLTGRDADTKGQLIEELTAAYGRVCGGEDKLYVVIDEVERELGCRWPAIIKTTNIIGETTYLSG